MTASFHKIDQKTYKGIISSLHFSTFLNILPKLRYFEGKNNIQIGYISYSVLCFPYGPMKGGDILDFQKGGNLIKEGYTPLTNYVMRMFFSFIHSYLHTKNQS